MNERLQVFRRQNFMTGMTDNYSYDALYQLTQVTRGASVTENYGYDAVGNRLSALGVSPWTYDFSNRLTGTPATSFTYDKNGNMLTKSSTSGTAVYSWDLENRLLSATVPANNATPAPKDTRPTCFWGVFVKSTAEGFLPVPTGDGPLDVGSYLGAGASAAVANGYFANQMATKIATTSPFGRMAFAKATTRIGAKAGAVGFLTNLVVQEGVALVKEYQAAASGQCRADLW